MPRSLTRKRAKDANVDVTGASVTLAAGTTVGASDNLLDTEIATLAGGTTTGGFYIDEMDAITIDGVDTGSSEFNLTAGGAVTLNDAAVTTAGNVSITAVGGAIEASDDDDADILADGNVSLTGDGIGAAAATIIIAEHDGTDTNDASLTLNNTGVSAETIDVEVLSNAFNAVSITLADADSTADIAFAGTDVIDIDSTSSTQTVITDVDASTNGMAFTFAQTDPNGEIDVTFVTTGNNAVTITGEKNIALANGAIDAGTGAVALTATAGGIADLDGGANSLITAGDLSLTAVNANQSIGGGDTLEVTITGTLTASASDGVGGIKVINAGDLIVGTVNAGTGDVALISTSGSIIDDTSDIDAVNISLTANASGQSVGAEGSLISVTLTGGDLTASANSGTGGVFVSASGDLSIASVDAGSGDVELSAFTNITSTTAESIADITAGGNVTLRGYSVGAEGTAIVVTGGTGTLSVTASGASGLIDFDQPQLIGPI